MRMHGLPGPHARLRGRPRNTSNIRRPATATRPPPRGHVHGSFGNCMSLGNASGRKAHCRGHRVVPTSARNRDNGGQSPAVGDAVGPPGRVDAVCRHPDCSHLVPHALLGTTSGHSLHWRHGRTAVRGNTRHEETVSVNTRQYCQTPNTGRCHQRGGGRGHLHDDMPPDPGNHASHDIHVWYCNTRIRECRHARGRSRHVPGAGKPRLQNPGATPCQMDIHNTPATQSRNHVFH
jgi:hypothetical protein